MPGLLELFEFWLVTKVKSGNVLPGVKEEYKSFEENNMGVQHHQDFTNLVEKAKQTFCSDKPLQKSDYKT